MLNGDSSTEGSVAYQVAQAVAKIVADAPEAYDTLVEIATWITDHADSASAMNMSITTNASDIATLEALVGSLPETASATTIVDYVSEVVSALETGVQEVTTGTTNGTISVDGTEVSVAGLSSAAYTDSSAYEVAGAAAEVQSALESYETTTDARLDELEGAFEEVTTEEINAFFTEE